MAKMFQLLLMMMMIMMSGFTFTLTTASSSFMGEMVDPPHNGADCGFGVECFPCLNTSQEQEQEVLRQSPSCSNGSQIFKGFCLSNRKNKIASSKVSSAAECCSLCGSNSQCQGYVFFQGTTCNLFSQADISELTNKSGTDCTAGLIPAPAPMPVPPPGTPCKNCPNIVLMFTDDQDLTIGGWDGMDQTKKLIRDAGAEATSWTIHTPICAPSRAELLSGRYYHNVKNAAFSPPSKLCGSGAVGHVDLINKVYPFTFTNNLRIEKGYTTGLFGKCMNGGCYNPLSMNGAFDRWFEGTNYQGGSFYDNQSPGNNFPVGNYSGGYGTSVIGNKTIEWINAVAGKGRPFFIYFAPHAPHSPATPSAWYKEACPNTTSPRNPAYNYSSPDFHNLVARQPPLNEDDATAIDTLARKRCQTLLSVDDSYAGIHGAIAAHGLLDNTYFLVSSDHGYNLGQHRLPSNKFLLYDHSLRIPQLFSGPGIPAGTKLPFRGTQVDIAPTILGFAGINTPSTMDGKSIVPLLVTNTAEAPLSVQQHLKTAMAPQRNYSFHEYYNQGPWELDTRHALDDWSNTYIGLYGDFQTSTGSGFYKYAEYDPYGKQSNFTSVYLYELFDLANDPYELHNIYNASSAELKAVLHSAVRSAYECQGTSCQ